MKHRKSRKDKATYCGRTRTAKIRYRTLADAKSARAALEYGLEKEVRVYRCPECKGYHLTTEKQYEYGNARTVWKTPDRTVSSREKLNTPEEEQDERG